MLLAHPEAHIALDTESSGLTRGCGLVISWNGTGFLPAHRRRRGGRSDGSYPAGRSDPSVRPRNRLLGYHACSSTVSRA